MTYREISYSILTQLSQNQDDSNITLRQILFWVTVVSNRLIKQSIEKNKNNRYLNIIDVEVKKNLKDKLYIDLPKDLIDIEANEGIEFVEYCSIGCEVPIKFSVTTAASKQSLYGNPFTTPSHANPYFYITKDKVFLLGLDCLDVECLSIGVYISTSFDNLCDLDKEFPLSSDLVEILIFRVMSLVRFGLMVEPDRLNDGSASTSNIPKISQHEQENEQEN